MKIFKTNIWLLSILLVLFTQLPIHSLTIDVRSFDHQGFTRLVLEGDTSFKYDFQESGKSLKIRIDDRVNTRDSLKNLEGSYLIESVSQSTRRGRSEFDVRFKSSYSIQRHFVLERPYRLVFDVAKGAGPQRNNQVEVVEESPQVLEDEEPPQRQPRSRDKKVVIETICIDPGHGGNDLGAIGSTQVSEKDITLAVGKKLRRMIESKLGLRVIMTREEDLEVSLDSRVALANNQKAQLFVSIHVNGSFRKSARGPETFFVSLQATDPESMALAQKENEALGDIDEIAENDDLKLILWNMAQTEYIKESSKLAEFIQNELNVLLNTINRGVKQAPFRVLMRASMPAVLIEVAFLSNPREEKKLTDDAFLDKVANSIYSGIAKFIYYQNNLFN